MVTKTSDSETSAKQIAANRANALRSTGPLTVAGKAISARNALGHGLCAETPVLPGEDEVQYKQFRGHVLDDLAPDGMLECAMVERIAVLQWRLARAGRIEAAMFALEHARRTHRLAYDRWKESDPGPVPSWNRLRENPPPAQIWILDDDAPHVIEAAKKRNAAEAAQREADGERAAAWEDYRGMIDARTFDHFMENPQALETLSRYEVGLYRQLESALRQYWLVAGSRQRRRSDAPPELVQDVSSGEAVPDDVRSPLGRV